MTSNPRDPASAGPSADDLFADWNPDASPGRLAARRASTRDGLVLAGPVGRPRRPGHVDCDRRRPAPPGRGGRLRLGGAPPDGRDDPGAVAAAEPRGRRLPRLGEAIGGFRLVSELGRGAFARVYLAHEVALGNRPVALKVSRAEGDEPRILARLQHTHIVPIHSVHDDPATGLRLICMPYFGGANLAQVLDAAADAARTTRAGAWSRRSTSSPGPSPTCGLAPARSAPRRPPGRRRRGPGRRVAASRLASLRRSLLGRGSRAARRTPRRPAGAREADARAGQPARQFLRGSDLVRASAWIAARLAEGLEHAHSRGLLHRDLKPSNILIAADGTPMLLDFNLAAESLEADPEDGDERADRRHAPLHVARAPRRLQPARHDPARGRRRAVGHLRPRPDPLRDGRRPARLRRAAPRA